MKMIKAMVLDNVNNNAHYLSGEFKQFLELIDKYIDLYDNDYLYMVGIDQSTSCTGITVASTGWELMFVIEFPKQFMDEIELIRKVAIVIKRVTRQTTVPLVVTEEPLIIRQVNYSKNLVKFRENIVSELSNRLPNFDRYDKDQCTSIYPNTWKTHVVSKEKVKRDKALAKQQGRKYKSRYSDKSAIAEDICDLFPRLSDFRWRCESKDYDAFDSLGILYGYLKENYKNGERILTKSIGMTNQKANYPFVMFIDNEEDVTQEKILSPVQQDVKELKVFTYNEDYTLIQNAENACSRAKVSVMQITDIPTILSLCFMFRRIYKPEMTVILYVYKRSYLTSNVKFSNILEECKYVSLD